MKSIRMALVQMMSQVGDVAGNLAPMRGFVEQAAAEGAQLVCFPETSLTGYGSSRAHGLALSRSSTEVLELFDLADSLGIAVCFGLFERDEGGKVFIAQPLHVSGSTLWHRKTHLGSKEQKTVTPGEMVETISVFGVQVGVEVCWETRFPELASIQRAQGAEVVLMPFASGASGLKRRASWMKYLPARASDNGMYVLACNALLDTTSTASPTAFGGGLLAIDPQGEVLAEHFELEDFMLICDLSGKLPREADEPTMSNSSFFDARRPELFARYYNPMPL